MGRRRKKGGEGGFIRIQNKSDVKLEIKLTEGRNVDDMGMDAIEGIVGPGEQLPKESCGKPTPFEDGDDNCIYQYIEGDVKNRFQKEGWFQLKACPVGGAAAASLKLTVDHDSWDCTNPTSEANGSPVVMVADIDDEDGAWKIEIRIYNNYDTKCWMGTLEEVLAPKPLLKIGLPGTHDSGTYCFDKDKGASPDSDLTEGIAKVLDRGRLLGKLNTAILKGVFERLCQCQSKTIKEQLEAGIRYLDLRIAYHADSGEYFTCHGVFCANMVDVMSQITEFLNENPKELLLLEFKHLYGMDDKHEEFLSTIVMPALGDKAANRDDVTHMSTMDDFWKHHFQAIVFYKKRSEVKGTDFYRKVWPLSLLVSPWPNTGDTNELHDKLAENMGGRDAKKFFVLQGILSPSQDSVKNSLVDGSGVSIKSFADKCSCKVVDWCEDEWMGKHDVNIVIVDFFENCSMIPSIINYNRRS